MFCGKKVLLFPGIKLFNKKQSLGTLKVYLSFFRLFFSKRFVLLRVFILKTDVDYNGRCETPVGNSGKAETPQEYATRRLSSRPTESEQPGIVIN